MKIAAGMALAVLIATPVLADTLPEALASAYASNPDLTAQRALVRQFDEGVPQALSAGRPVMRSTSASSSTASSMT